MIASLLTLLVLVLIATGSFFAIRLLLARNERAKAAMARFLERHPKAQGLFNGNQVPDHGTVVMQHSTFNTQVSRSHTQNEETSVSQRPSGPLSQSYLQDISVVEFSSKNSLHSHHNRRLSEMEKQIIGMHERVTSSTPALHEKSMSIQIMDTEELAQEQSHDFHSDLKFTSRLRPDEELISPTTKRITLNKEQVSDIIAAAGSDDLLSSAQAIIDESPLDSDTKENLSEILASCEPMLFENADQSQV